MSYLTVINNELINDSSVYETIDVTNFPFHGPWKLVN